MTLVGERPAGASAATSNSRLDAAARLHHRLARWYPELLVAGVIAFGLVVWRAELTVVTRLNDSSIHSEMVRYATAQLRAGHVPLEGWYPYLGLGSPQFLHYQSLGAMLTGALGLAIGADRAFSLTLYLLVATWPISVYISARLFRFDRWTAALCAAVSPFVVSAIHVGFESTAYLWVGYGVWTQLWAMWTLPLAWGLVWRAVGDRRFVLPAAVAVAATIAFHFETGYLAIWPIVIFPFLVPSRLRSRLARAVGLAVATAALSAWVVFPLIRLSAFASINQFLQRGPDANSYGARRELSWLVTGHLFDEGRLPILTALAAVGLVVCLYRFSRDPRARALVVSFVVSFLLFFGRPTWGVLTDVIPGSHDLFLRRFITGVQLSGILLCGVGACAAGASIGRGGRQLVTALRRRPRGIGLLGELALLALLVGYLAPAWTQSETVARSDASDITAQRVADQTAGAQLDALITRLQRLGGGRVYAGLPFNWGSQFVVGSVPVFKYLTYRDVDEVGYTLRTASLMTDPEQEFDESVPSDYTLFGIRYLLLPAGRRPLVHAELVERRGDYVLWELPTVHYFQVIETRRTIHATRADLGTAAEPLLHSRLASEGIYPTLSLGDRPAATPTLQPGESVKDPGSVSAESADLADGTASATVSMHRRGVVLLKVSYDPGWQASVDGREVATEIIAPAMVGVVVGPGLHRVVLSYRSDASYPVLFAIGIAGLVVLVWLAILDRRRRRRRRMAADATAGEGPLVPSQR